MKPLNPRIADLLAALDTDAEHEAFWMGVIEGAVTTCENIVGFAEAKAATHPQEARILVEAARALLAGTRAAAAAAGRHG